MVVTSKNSRLVVKRRGMAPLEFVMGLPVLVCLMAFIFGVAAASVMRINLAMTTRHMAWMQRDRNPPGTDNTYPNSARSPQSQLARVGQQSIGLIKNPFSEHPRGIEIARGRQTLQLPPVYRVGAQAMSSVDAQAEHWVLADPWDHLSLPLNNHYPLIPNYQAFVIGGGGIVTNILNQITSAVSSLLSFF